MKNTGLLVALGLIGYGLYKFTQSGSTATGLGSPLKSSGTALIPNIFGARAPGTAPVTNGGYSGGSTAKPPGGGGDLSPLITAGAAGASALYKWLSGLGEDKSFYEIDVLPPDLPGAISQINNLSFDTGTSFGDGLINGVDDIDTSAVGEIA